MRIDYAIVFVSDMAAAVEFYRDVVGLPLRFDSPEWTEFATDGSTLALHATPDGPAGRDPATNPAGAAQVGFTVDDIDAFHARMQEHGVRCLQPPTELHGARLAKYVGPDDMPFGIGERRG